MQTYQLYVMSLSPYSDKIRLFLQLKRLPFLEVRENMKVRETVLRARTGRTMVPVVITPTDEALNDSTAITRRLERDVPEPPLRPRDPGRRGFDALLEEYADEWIVRIMLASRWLHETDAEQARTIIAADMTCGAPGADMETARQLFPQGITATMPAMGATPESLPFLIDDLRGLCRDLDALFAAHRFLGGEEPSVGDLAFWGQLNQVRRDPTGATIVGDGGLAHLNRWMADVERRAEGQPAEHPATAPPDGAALAPLCRRMAATYLRFTTANARAVDENPKGLFAVELGAGYRFTAARAGYNRKCLQALLAELETALAASERLVGGEADRIVLAALADAGPLLDAVPAVRRAAAA